ncbi:MAG: hypothetical protein WAV07_09270 [Candidatus Contendobacter sp.]
MSFGSMRDQGDLNGDGHADLAGLAGSGSIWYTTNLSAWTRVSGGLSQLQVGDLRDCTRTPRPQAGEG